ncbi:MAG TPA: maleylpyruvate isomerase family mycothiol-dependent enzyme, partial [Mycobacteriales bacterium]
DLGRSMSPAALYERWQEGRRRLDAALRAADPATRVPWYGPAMSLASFVTARLMETWAHGQDVIDAVDGEPVVSERLRHVCHIGVGARPYAFRVHGQEDPGTPVRVEARAPSGETWSWGPEDAADRVTGTALDLALVLTQRRHRDDTGLVVDGPVAEQWISIAQSFAGPAGTGRAPGLRRMTQ